MSAMWRVVCKGPGPLDRPRRVIDRGPLQASEQRALAFADWLRSTGLYESVLVVRSGNVEAAPQMAEVSSDAPSDP